MTTTAFVNYFIKRKTQSAVINTSANQTWNVQKLRRACRASNASAHSTSSSASSVREPSCKTEMNPQHTHRQTTPKLTNNTKSQISISISPILFLHLFHFLLSTRASLSLTFSLPPLPHAHLSCSAPPASISNANKTRSLIRRILVLAYYNIGGAAAKQSAILKSIFHLRTIQINLGVRK